MMKGKSERKKITFETLNKGNYTIIDPSEIAEINKKIKSAMTPIIRDFERKERLSYEHKNKNMEQQLTAEEARRMAQHSLDTSNLNRLKGIEEDIKYACSKNEFHIYEYSTLSSSVVNHLRNRGFGVQDLSSQKEGVIFKISW